MRVLVYINSFGDCTTLMLEALVDTGASHSFLNPKIFSKEINHKINKFKEAGANIQPNELNLRLINASIQTINHKNTSCCVEVSLGIQIETWLGKQDFIISDEIENEACILGRNFLKLNGVRIDYGTDYMEIPFKLTTHGANTELMGIQDKQIYKIETVSISFFKMLFISCIMLLESIVHTLSGYSPTRRE